MPHHCLSPLSLLVVLLFLAASQTRSATQEAISIGTPASGHGVSQAPRHGRVSTLTVPTTGLTLYLHGNPTHNEQLLLELVNRARANPEAEAVRYGIGLNDGLNPGTISSSPKPPLAFHSSLITASRNHSQWMIDADVFSHTGAGGSTPNDRMAAAGYPFTGSWAWGENIAWAGTTGSPPNQTAYTKILHENLFRSAGHRKNILDPVFDEAGFGVMSGQFTQSGVTYNAVMATEGFAKSGGSPSPEGPFLVGVIYNDGAVSSNNLFDAGEGISGVKVVPAGGSHYTITGSSGGYAVPIPSLSGTVQIDIEGGPFTRFRKALILTPAANSKLDIQLSDFIGGYWHWIGSFQIPYPKDDPQEDPDGDRFLNEQEFHQKTDPTNAASRFEVSGLRRVGNDIYLTCSKMEPGGVYSLRNRSFNASGSWQTVATKRVTTPSTNVELRHINAPAEGGLYQVWFTPDS